MTNEEVNAVVEPILETLDFKPLLALWTEACEAAKNDARYSTPGTEQFTETYYVFEALTHYSALLCSEEQMAAPRE